MSSVKHSPPFNENAIRPDSLKAMQKKCYDNDVKWLQGQKESFVHVSCPACSDDFYEKDVIKDGFTFVRCQNCSTLYMNPRPSEQLMNVYYSRSENYEFWVEHIFPRTEEARSKLLHEPRLEKVLSILTNKLSCKGGTLLEVGPGFGSFAHLAQECGFFSEVFVVEPTPCLAEACKKRGLTVFEALDTIINKKKVDYIASFEVIEHLFNVQVFLEKCFTALNNNGIVVFTCPNACGFDVEILREKSSAIDCEHVNLFNPKSLQLLLEKNNYTVVYVETPGTLDAELVRKAVLNNETSLEGQPFLQKVLIERWESLGSNFQNFLSENLLSSHLLIVAQKNE